MTEEIIIFNKSDVESLEEAIKRLEQENKEFEMLAKSLYKRIEELEKENEALAFRERLYKADYEASEQENKEMKEKIEDKPLQCLLYNAKQNKCALFTKTVAYRSALEEIKEMNKLFFERKYGYPEDLIKIDNIINEVLK